MAMNSQRHRAPIFDRNVEYGGWTRARKKPRPISLRKPMHVVLMSSNARGEFSFLRPGRPARIDALLKRLAKRFGIRLLERGIRGDHLHLLTRTEERRAFQKFLRALAGLVARIAAGAERGRPWIRKLSSFEKAGFKVRRLAREGAGFWDARPFTRILEPGRQASSVRRQVLHKAIGAVGFAAPTKGIISRDSIETESSAAESSA